MINNNALKANTINTLIPTKTTMINAQSSDARQTDHYQRGIQIHIKIKISHRLLIVANRIIDTCLINQVQMFSIYFCQKKIILIFCRENS